MPSIYDTSAGRTQGTSRGSASTGRGLYGNLPPGTYNAGGTPGNNAYVRDTQGNELVSTNLNGLLDRNGAYIQNARREGLNLAGDRGMMNSSIAAGNSQRSAIQAGLPIAQGDAAAYGATAAQNQDALNQNMLTSMNNETQLGTAQIGANASMYGDDLGLVNARENRAYGGEQQGLDRSFQDYMAQSGHSRNVDMANLGYRNNLGMGLLDIGGRMLVNQQSFYNNAGLEAMDNPAIMSNPEAFGNYMNFISSPFSGYIDNILANLVGSGGGQP